MHSITPIPWHQSQDFQDQLEWQLRLLWSQQQWLPWEFHPTYTNKQMKSYVIDQFTKCFNSPCYIGTLIRTMGQGYTWLFHIQQSLPIRPRFPQMNHGQRNHLAKRLCCLQRNTYCQQLPINEANFPLASYIKLMLTSSPWMDVTIPCTAFVWLHGASHDRSLWL